MEIVSPGGLLSTITIDEILRLNKAHQSRNAYVTRVLREMGYMRELGEGIPRIYALMDERDIATPNIEANVESFRMALYHRSVFSPKDQQWLDSLAQFILNRDEQRVVLLGKDGHLITPREIREVAKIVDTEDYRRLVESLQRKGILYSVRPDSELRRKYQASQRIDIGRFAIRPIGELLHFYDELVDILRRQESVERINHQEIYVALRRKSTNNPYCHSTTECIQSLRCLGFVDENNMPMQRLADLWQKRAKTNHKKA